MMYTQLVVDQTYYFMEKVKGNNNHFIKEGIATVLDFTKPLGIEYRNISSIVHPGLLAPQDDQNGNKVVVIPLSNKISLFIRDVYYIDEKFIQRMKGTSLYDLVHDKNGCYAISAFEVVESVKDEFDE